MAGIRATDLQYVLNNTTIPEYQQTYNIEKTFIDTLGGFKKGKARIQIKVRYSGNDSVGSYGEDDSIATAGKQSRRRVTQDYRRVKVTIDVDGLQENTALLGGVDGINDLIMDEANNGIQDLLGNINTQLLSDGTGNSSKDIDGIQHQIADDNTWFGLARGTYTWLKSYINDNGGTNRALTEELLRTIHQTMINTRGSNYNAIWCGSAVANAYEDLMGDRKRYVTMTIGDLAMKKLEYEGRPLVEIPSYPANRMDFVKTSDHEVWYQPQKSRSSKGREVMGPFKVEQIGLTTDSTKFAIIMYVNMLCKNPWLAGSLQDVE